MLSHAPKIVILTLLWYTCANADDTCQHKYLDTCVVNRQQCLTDAKNITNEECECWLYYYVCVKVADCLDAYEKEIIRTNCTKLHCPPDILICNSTMSTTSGTGTTGSMSTDSMSARNALILAGVCIGGITIMIAGGVLGRYILWHRPKGYSELIVNVTWPGQSPGTPRFVLPRKNWIKYLEIANT